LADLVDVLPSGQISQAAARCPAVTLAEFGNLSIN
jgi:hypothetical protein